MVYIYILLALVFAIVLTWFVRRYAIKKSILDTPNQRSSHTIPTPRGGGLAIVITWFGVLVWLFMKKEMEANLFYALISGGILAIVSLFDDILSLSPNVRMLAQAASVGLALFFIRGSYVLDFGFFELNFWWLFVPGAFIGLIWFINLYNFLDGIDGYAASQAIFVSLAFVLLTQDNLLLFLIAAVLGFLVWNWQPAKIFMGDVGSTVLGFILGFFTIYYSQGKNISIFTLLIPSALFWFDATFTLFRRWRNKEKLSEAHKKHAYQRLVQSGFSHQKTVLYGMGVNVVLFSLAYGAFKLPKYVLFFFFAAILFMYLVTKWVDRRKAFE